jgi:hypothetical protein
MIFTRKPAPTWTVDHTPSSPLYFSRSWGTNLRRPRPSLVILACIAVLGASLSAIVDCAGTCAASVCPSAPLAAEAHSCHQGATPNSAPCRQGNCAHHCVSQLTARVTVAVAAAAPQADAHGLLAVTAYLSAEGISPKFVQAQRSLASPFRSGRSICRRSSLLRI